MNTVTLLGVHSLSYCTWATYTVQRLVMPHPGVEKWKKMRREGVRKSAKRQERCNKARQVGSSQGVKGEWEAVQSRMNGAGVRAHAHVRVHACVCVKIRTCVKSRVHAFMCLYGSVLVWASVLCMCTWVRVRTCVSLCEQPKHFDIPMSVSSGDKSVGGSDRKSVV